MAGGYLTLCKNGGSQGVRRKSSISAAAVAFAISQAEVMAQRFRARPRVAAATASDTIPDVEGSRTKSGQVDPAFAQDAVCWSAVEQIFVLRHEILAEAQDLESVAVY